MTKNKRLVNIILEDDFGRVMTAIKTDIFLADIMDKILEVIENDGI